MGKLVMNGHEIAGTTAARHTNIEVGQPYYDTDLGGLHVYDGTLWRPACGIMVEERTFTETAGAGTYTGSITVPAGATILDICCQGIALWNASGAVSLKVGDTDDDGWFVATDLKATDLLAGEANNFEHPGGKAGVYLASEQRVFYSASARTINAIVTAAGTAGTTGRTRVLVMYALPNSVAATKV